MLYNCLEKSMFVFRFGDDVSKSYITLAGAEKYKNTIKDVSEIVSECIVKQECIMRFVYERSLIMQIMFICYLHAMNSIQHFSFSRSSRGCGGTLNNK